MHNQQYKGAQGDGNAREYISWSTTDKLNQAFHHLFKIIVLLVGEAILTREPAFMKQSCINIK